MARTTSDAQYEAAIPYLSLLLSKGIKAIPVSLREAVVDVAMDRIAESFGWFWLHFVFIHVKGHGWQRACPDDKPRVHENGRDWAWQVAIADWINRYDLLLILKARQIGFTYIIAALLLWAGIHKEEQAITVVANKLGSSKRLVRRAIQMHRRLPDWLQERVPLTNPAVSRLEFGNGSFAEPFAGSPDSAVGDASDWLFVDEIGLIEYLNDWFAANEAIADGGGKLVMFGTARDNGIEQWVKECLDGVEVASIEVEGADGTAKIPVMLGDNEMHFMFIPDYMHPERTEEWRERKMKTYRGNLRNFEREHPLTVQMAFIAQGSGFFDNIALVRHIERERKVFEARDRRGTFLPNGKGGWVFVEDPYGHCVMHATPAEIDEILRARRPFVAGADCAGDRKTGDYHAASFLQVGVVPKPNDIDFKGEIVPHRQILSIHGYMDADHYAELLARAGYFFGNAVLAVEVNGVGTAVVKSLRKMSYPAIFMRRTKSTTRGEKVTREYGWYTTGPNKLEAYGEFERCFRNDWLEVRDMETLLEMGNIIHLGGYKVGAREPKHDDRPDGCSMAMAIVDFAHGYAGGMAPSAEDDEPAFGTGEWLNRRIEARLAAEAARSGSIGHENRGILA